MSIKCNLCNGTEFESIYKREDIEIITTKEKFDIDINNVICKNCGLVFQNPFMDKEKLISFYSNQYRHGVSEYRGGNVRQQQKNYVQKFLNNKKGKILDIGSFEGYFLNLFKEEGWETIGIEPSSDAAKICRKKYGIEVYDEMFEYTLFNEKDFDLITIRHVLEHVDDPMNTILLMKKYLKDDGIIFIEVPNIERFDYFNIADSYDFQHIYNFSVNVLRNYLNKCGLEIINIDCNLPYAGMRFICKKGEYKQLKSDYENTKKIILNYKSNREENLSLMTNLLKERNMSWKDKKIYIYGAGFHTAQMFQYVIDKEKFNIMGLIDMDEKKEGKVFFGYETYSANKIKNLDIDALIISSYAFQEEIYQYLKPLEEDGVEIVKLYSKTYSYDTL
jgi:SAM-dependent methyltransferase